MLKDIFNKKSKKSNKDIKDRILNSLVDGYVDIKAYKHFDDGTKKLIYHDTGDNTVTDWMRQVIVQLLSGYSFSYSGKDGGTTIGSGHTASSNTDAMLLNGSQYLWANTTGGDPFSGHPISANTSIYQKTGASFYAVFPTKVLLGTGCEFVDWENLQEQTETAYPSWYANRLAEYGNADQFNSVASNGQNFYSGTVGSQGTYIYSTTSTSLVKTVTVNDPVSSSAVSSSADMAKRTGVVGAIKTPYVGDVTGKSLVWDSINNADLLVSSEEGDKIVPKYAGGGFPCFLYFNRTVGDTSGNLDWDDQSSDIFISGDSTNSYLNRITFKVSMPAQTASTGHAGEYYPYNGYTIKQVGLFNDAYFTTSPETTTPSGVGALMPSGTLQAIKNVQPFSKTQDESIDFTWTLTI